MKVVDERRLYSAKRRACWHARASPALPDAERSGAAPRQDATLGATAGAAPHGDRSQAKTGRIDRRAQIGARRSARNRAVYGTHGTKLGLGQPSMPTRNKGNMGLPARWRHYHGAYYYRVPPGLESQWDGRTQY